MVHVTDSIVIARSAQEAFDAIVGMAAHYWQTSAIQSENVSGGPIGLGTRFKEHFQVLGEAVEAQCEVSEFEPGRALGWTGTAPDLSFQGRYTFTPEGDGSRLTYAATTTLGGRWAARAEAYEREQQAKTGAELQQIKAMLEGQGVEA